MSKRFVVVLAVLVAALAAYIAVYERTSLTSKQLDERKGKVLQTFVRDRVTRLSITRGGVRVVLERKLDDDGLLTPWKMLEPVRVDADQDSVDKVLGELEWLSARRLLDDVSPGDLAKFGLDKPALRFGYRVAGEDYEARVGAKDAQGDNYYLTIEGAPTVYVVPKTLLEALDHDVGYFREKQLLGDITRAWARRLLISHGSTAHELSKEDGRWWLLDAPKSFADQERVQSLIDTLDGLRAQRFLEGDAKKEALAQLRDDVYVVDLRVIPDTHREDKTAQRFVLRFAGACRGHQGERYAQAGEKGDPVCVRDEDVAAFEGDASALRLMRVLGVDPSQVEALSFTSGDVHWSLKRDGEKWLAEGLAPPDRLAVEAWLRDLLRAQAEEVVKARPIDASVSLEVSLVPDKKQKLSVDLSSASAAWLAREGEPAVLRFPAALSALLEPFPGRFSSLSLWPEHKPSEVVALSARDAQLARKLTLDAGSFRLRKGGPELPDALHVRELVRDLVKLQAVSNVSDTVRPEFGISTSSTSVSFALADGKELRLELGAETELGLYARVDGARVVLVEPAVKTLVHELAGGERSPRLPAAEAAPEPGEDELHDEHEHEHMHEHGHDEGEDELEE